MNNSTILVDADNQSLVFIFIIITIIGFLFAVITSSRTFCWAINPTSKINTPIDLPVQY